MTTPSGPAPTAPPVDPTYTQQGDLWIGYRRDWETAEAEVVARYAGVPIDSVRSGRLAVTLAEVERYMTAHGIAYPTTIPAKLPPCTPEMATALVDMMVRAGLALVPARVGTKPPISEWWDKREPIGRDAAVAHLVDGGNIDYDAGQSGVVTLDSEDEQATATLTALGLVPDAFTAKSQDPTSEKFGGAHFIVPIPDGVDRNSLTTHTAIKLPGGGTVDVLAGPADPTILGTRVVVGLGSRLDVAPGYRYGPSKVGVFATGEFGNRGRADWLFNREVECPESVAPLHGILLPRQKRVYVPNPNSDRITQQVDALSIEDILAGQTRAWITGYDSDGCYVLGWDEGSSPRSSLAHDGCKLGFGVHAFSGHMAEEWGRPHGSRLQFAELIHGLSTEQAAAAYEIDLSTPLTSVPAPDGFVYQEREPVAAQATATAGPQVHEPVADQSATGADTTTAGDAGSAEDLEDNDSDARATVTAEELEKVRRLREEIAVRERRLALMTPGLKRADHWAKCTGVYLHGLVTALICHSTTLVPPNVVLPSRQGLTFSKAMGVSVNAFGLLCGPSAAGKTVTMGVANAAIPIGGIGIITIGDGTAEGICRKARNADRKEVEITATGILVTADEFDTVAEEMGRNGSKYDGFTRKVWMGVEAGSTASDKKRDAQLPAHSTRVCMLYGAQPGALSPLIGQAGRGTPQRFDFGLVGVVHSSERDKLYGSRPTMPILMNQDKLPWWTPTGLPPGYTPPKPAEEGDDDVVVTEGGLPGFDHAEAIWVGIPAVVQKIIDAEGDRAANRAKDWDKARREDEAGISGHNVLLQERQAFSLASWDGEYDISMAHWDAAGLLLEMRQLVYEAAVIEARIADGNAKTQEGEGKGIVNAGAKAAEAATTARRLQSACDRIMDLIDAAAGIRAKASVRKTALKNNPRLFAEDGGVNTAYLDASLSGPQRGLKATALTQLRGQSLIAGDSVIRRPVAAPAPTLTVAPAFGSVGESAA
ncbi:Bifunctional DNA primase/polymerase, N-terminal [Mycobacteroides abscessus subsp. abscessus]|nr:Bifunctional DNA primase/polymerase, N-terminal [Mycobacteroides abscessus subsp. abscessus]